jgi:hypothetical protein
MFYLFCRGVHVLFVLQGGSCFICFAGGFMFYLLLYLFTYTGVQHDIHITLCSFCFTVLVRQEVPTLPEHMC